MQNTIRFQAWINQHTLSYAAAITNSLKNPSGFKQKGLFHAYATCVSLVFGFGVWVFLHMLLLRDPS